MLTRIDQSMLEHREVCIREVYGHVFQEELEQFLVFQCDNKQWQEGKGLHLTPLQQKYMIHTIKVEYY